VDSLEDRLRTEKGMMADLATKVPRIVIDQSKVMGLGGESVVESWGDKKVLKHSLEHGFIFDLHTKSDGRTVLGLRSALPSEQRERISLSRSIFEDSARIWGITSGESGEPTFAIMQERLKGEAPRPAKIDEFMKSRGFRKVPDDGRIGQFMLADKTWVRDDGKILVTDAEPRNFVDDGETIRPVDLIIQRVRDPRIWDILTGK